jgi:hypothetical protein
VQAVDRFFGAYVKYWTAYDHESLLYLLDCLNDLEEELQETGDVTLQVFAQYVPLDAIRRYWHNHEEMTHRIGLAKSVEVPGIHTDLPYLCMIDTRTLERVIEEIDEEYREEDRQTIDETVHYYGDIVNIGHIIFNITSLVMDTLVQHGIEGTSREYALAREIMQWDPARRKPLTFSGWFEGDPGLVCSVLGQLYAQARGEEQEESPKQ